MEEILLRYKSLTNGQHEQDDLDLQRKEKCYDLYKSIQKLKSSVLSPSTLSNQN